MNGKIMCILDQFPPPSPSPSSSPPFPLSSLLLLIALRGEGSPGLADVISDYAKGGGGRAYTPHRGIF